MENGWDWSGRLEVLVLVVRTMSPMARVDRHTGVPPCQTGITSGVIVSGQLEPGVRQVRGAVVLGVCRKLSRLPQVGEAN